MYSSFPFKEKTLYLCYAVVNLLFFSRQREPQRNLYARQLKHNTIIKKYCQAFFSNFSNFFRLFLFFSFWRIFMPFHIKNKRFYKVSYAYILYICRARTFLFLLCALHPPPFQQKKEPPPSTKTLFYIIHNRLSATATRLAIARAFLARFARGRIHGTRVIAFCLPSAIGTRHFIRVHFYQFFKLLSALCAFIL